jgi:TolB-like protein
MRAYISRSVEFLAGVTRPRLPVRRWRTPLTLLVLALLVGPVPAAVFGQQPARPRSVLVVPAVNRSADPALDAVAVTTLQTIEGAFARSRDFVVLSGGGRFVAEGGIPENAAVPIQLAEAGLVDYVVSGAVSRGDDGRIVIEITVWDGNTGAVAVLARESTSTLFETFAVADDLRARLLPVLGSDRASSETIVLDETRRESAGRAGSPTILGPEVTPDPPGVDPPMDVPLQGFESRPRSLVLRLQSGGGFVGAGGLDVYPGENAQELASSREPP